MSTTVSTLPAQLYVGARAPSAKRFKSPVNDTGWRSKPESGGLWTSTYVEQTGSDWVQWCFGNDYGVPESGWQSWLLKPRQDARIWTIDSFSDLRAMLCDYGVAARYGAFQVTPDFERIARFYDAIHLTEAGQWATRHTTPNLYGWDCESTLWLTWAFEEIRDLGVRKFEGRQDS